MEEEGEALLKARAKRRAGNRVRDASDFLLFMYEPRRICASPAPLTPNLRNREFARHAKPAAAMYVRHRDLLPPSLVIAYLHCPGELVVDHVLHALNVQTASSNIRGNKHRVRPASEPGVCDAWHRAR